MSLFLQGSFEYKIRISLILIQYERQPNPLPRPKQKIGQGLKPRNTFFPIITSIETFKETRKNLALAGGGGEDLLTKFTQSVYETTSYNKRNHFVSAKKSDFDPKRVFCMKNGNWFIWQGTFCKEYFKCFALV